MGWSIRLRSLWMWQTVSCCGNRRYAGFVATMRIAAIVPDMKSKIPDIVVKCADFDRPEMLKIVSKTVERRCVLHAMKAGWLMPKSTLKKHDISIIL